MHAADSLDRPRDKLVGCMLNFYVLGLLTSLYIVYLRKRFLDPVAVKALLAVVALISLAQSILSAIGTLREVKTTHQAFADVENTLVEMKAVQALWGASNVLICSYFVYRMYKVINSVVVASVLSLLAAASFVLKLAIAAAAFRVDDAGYISERVTESLVDVQWSQSVIEAVLSVSISITLTVIIIRHRSTHGPAWHAPVLRSLLLETPLLVIPLAVALSCVKVASEPFVVAKTYTNVLSICLLTTLCSRTTRLVAPNARYGSGTVTHTSATASNSTARQPSIRDRRRSSITVVPFSVGGMVFVRARSLKAIASHLVLDSLEANGTLLQSLRLETNGLHGRSGHSPSCPSPRHQWRFSWPARSQQSPSESRAVENASTTQEKASSEPDVDMSTHQLGLENLVHTEINEDSLYGYPPFQHLASHVTPSWLHDPRCPTQTSDSPDRSAVHPQRTAFRRSLSYQSGRLSMLQDMQISSLHLPLSWRERCDSASLDDLALNFGRPSLSSEELGRPPPSFSPTGSHFVIRGSPSTSNAPSTPSELSFKCRGDVPLSPVVPPNGSSFVSSLPADTEHEATISIEAHRAMVPASTPGEVWRQTHEDGTRTPENFTHLAAAVPTSPQSTPPLLPRRLRMIAASVSSLRTPNAPSHLGEDLLPEQGSVVVAPDNKHWEKRTTDPNIQDARTGLRLTLITRRASV